VDLEGALDRLYQVPPDEFVEARNALAKELRLAGEKAAAESVVRRARPTPVAWAVNQLHFRARRELDALCEEGALLREAQESRFDAAEFTARRRAHAEALRAAADRGMALAGAQALKPNAAFRRRLESTLSLLGASPGGVTPPPGRMSLELESMGFDALTSAAPVPLPAKPKRETPPGGSQHAMKVAAVRESVEAIEKVIRRLEQEAESAEAKHTRAARDAEDAAERAAISAQARDEARRGADQARQKLDAAQLELDEARRVFDDLRASG
jgi:hypothetical protein